MCALRLLHLLTPLHRRSARVITLSTSPISKFRAADDERRQAKRNKLAGKLTVEAKALADLKVERAAVEGVRRTVEADLGPVRYSGDAHRRRQRDGPPMVHSRGCAAARPGRGAVALRSDADTAVPRRKPARRKGRRAR